MGYNAHVSKIGVSEHPSGDKPLSKGAAVKQKSHTSPEHITEPLSKNISVEGSSVISSTRNTEPLSESVLSPTTSTTSSNHTSVLHFYKIEDMRQSESAWVLFTRHMPTKQSFVIKMLRKYKDTRYSLEIVDKRQQCQLEALHWNRIFTPGIYLGLARIHKLDLQRKVVTLEEIVRNPRKERLDPDSDYALVMHQLSAEKRLDYILSEENTFYCKIYIKILVRRISEIHEQLAPLSIEEGRQWGSYEYLELKLLHNIALAAPIVDIDGTSSKRYSPKVRNTFTWLKDKLLHAFTHYAYQKYFEQRVQEQYIKRCHGDLKAPNIFMASYNDCSLQELWRHVWIIDAIDFNHSYSNIDVLSDLAMLVIDVQVHMKSPGLATFMVDQYLALSGQQNEAAQLVLAYYLVEKAFVGAAISFVYDNAPDLGQAFLEAAKMRMQCLIDMQNSIYFMPGGTILDG